MSSPIETFVSALEGKGRKPKNGAAHCPAHADKSPSLTFSEGDDGRVLVNCFAGCTTNAVVDALGLEMRDLFPAKNIRHTNPPKSQWISITPVPDTAPTPSPHPRLGMTTDRHVYLDTKGRLLGFEARWDFDNGKTFRPLTFGRMSNEDPSRARWGWRSWSGLAPIYGLNRLAKRPDAPVLVVEGEKTTDAARGLFRDYVAITSPGGSKQAAKADWSPLRGRKVVIWPDQDEPGRKYADDVVRLAMDAGAESVAVVEVP